MASTPVFLFLSISDFPSLGSHQLFRTFCIPIYRVDSYGRDLTQETSLCCQENMGMVVPLVNCRGCEPTQLLSSAPRVYGSNSALTAHLRESQEILRRKSHIANSIHSSVNKYLLNTECEPRAV